MGDYAIILYGGSEMSQVLRVCNVKPYRCHSKLQTLSVGHFPVALAKIHHAYMFSSVPERPYHLFPICLLPISVQFLTFSQLSETLKR